MTKDEVIQLAERIVSGVATDEEIRLYNQLFESFQTSEDVWKDEIYGSRAELEMAIKKAIMEKAGIKKPLVSMPWFKWAAAAAILVLAGTVSFFLFKRHAPEVPIARVQTQQERFRNDVMPGHEGAVLTLSNGKTIVLDSVNNGTLAQQGVAEIMKKDGEVVYSSQGGSSEIVYNTMTTPKGRQYSLVLADGSKVWLNASSSITFPTTFTGKERKVSITGEAYFEIAHKKEMPFIVQKGDVNVQVLGTHFNVNSYEDENSINVTLLEGLVKMTTGNVSTFIKPGQQAQAQQQNIKLIYDPNLDAVMAWKNGFFHFEKTDIGSLMRQLSRWYDVEVVYDKRIEDMFYAEIPRDTKLSDVLKALELTGKVRFEISGKKIIVIP